MCATRVQITPVLRLYDLSCVRRAYKRHLCYICMIWDVCDARANVSCVTFVWSEMCAMCIQTSPVLHLYDMSVCNARANVSCVTFVWSEMCATRIQTSPCVTFVWSEMCATRIQMSPVLRLCDLRCVRRAYKRLLCYVCMIWDLYDARTNVSCVTFVWSVMCVTRIQTSPVLRLYDLRSVWRTYKRLLCYVCMIWDLYDARTNVSCVTFVWSEICMTHIQTTPVLRLCDLRCVRRAYKRLLCYVCMIWDVCDAPTNVSCVTFVWYVMCATRLQTSPVLLYSPAYRHMRL